VCISVTVPTVWKMWAGFSVNDYEKGVKPHIMKVDVFVYAIDGAACA
jgi:hypothetical protein